MLIQRQKESEKSRDELIVGPPRWVPLLLSIVTILLVGFAFSLFLRQDKFAHIAGKPSNLGPAGPVTSLSEITREQAKENLVGRAVMMSDARVQDVVGDYLFWVGESESERVPVYLFGEGTVRQSELETTIRTGQRLRIFGYVTKVQDLSHLAGKLISDRERSTINEEPVIISAIRVEVDKDQPGRRPASE